MPALAAGNNIGILIKAEADTGAITATTVKLDEMGVAAERNAAKSATSFDNFNKSLDKVGGAAERTGKSLSTYLTAPIVGVGYEAVKMATNFQQTMELLHTNAGTAQSAIQGLSQSVLDMSSQVGAKPEELAKGLYHIASAGNGIWDTAKQLDILKIAAEGAAVGQASLDDTTYSLTSTMASNIKGAETASNAMGILTATVGAGDMKMADLNAAIGTGFLGTAANFGISLQSVGAALATLTDNGEHADAAATRLRMTWALMTSPSKQAAKLMEDIGVSSDGAALATDQMNTIFAKTGLTTTKLATDLQQPNGMNVALRDIQEQMKKAGFNAAETDAIMAKMFGGGRTDAALLTMLQNLDRTDEKFKLINESAGNFSEKFASQQDTANQKFKQAWAGIEADLIKLGTEILPVVTKDFQQFAHYVEDVSKWFNTLNGSQKDFVIHAAEVALAVGPALLVFGKLAQSLSSIGGLLSGVSKATSLMKFAPVAAEAGGLTEALAGGGGLLAALGPIGLGIGAVALAAGGGYLAYEHFKNMGSQLAENMKTSVSPEVKKFTDLAHDLGVELKGTSGAISFTELAQKNLDTSNQMVTISTKNLDQAQSNLDATQKTAKTRADDVATAQKGVKDAFDKFGGASPQYQTAVDDLTQKQNLLDQALADGAVKSLDMTIKTGQYRDALGIAGSALSDQRSLQDFLNNSLKGGIGVIAQFGPTAFAQVGSIAVLQNSINGVITSWNGAVVNIQNQNANVNSILLGTQSTIQRIQGQSNTLNATLSAANSSAGQLQGSMGQLQGNNMNIQGARHATGTNHFRGGGTWVGEQGPEWVNLPKGSQIKSNGQSMQRDGDTNNHSLSINTLIIQTPVVDGSLFDKLDQDTTLLGKGLTPNRGTR
jgi:TP901 family phage tail tape measure protein